jgi:hypothetical protein
LQPATAQSIHVSEGVREQAARHRDTFLNAKPFRHIVIDGFFEEAFAERLLEDFPRFDPKLAIAENGTVGGKAVNTKIREVSPTYRQLYDAISAPAFLEVVSQLSGISDLILDPKMFGGGTHENLHGQELDPHVDFNYDEAMNLHRRLNLIVYLNKGWKSEWGGGLEIHSNPRKPFENQVQTYDPLFNRCVMFETNEYSWHGFPIIDLPPGERHRSRKSISIYLYTKDRPAEEVAPMHGTFYVQRFLPDYIAAGRTLTENDVDQLRRLLIRRDGWIEMYQQMELRKNREIGDKNRVIQTISANVPAPLTGYVLQESAKGLFWDSWASSTAEIGIRPVEPVSHLVIRGWRPEDSPDGKLAVTINGSPAGEFPTGKGGFECDVRLPHAAQEPFRLTLEYQGPDRGAQRPGDSRDLAYILQEIQARHPLMRALAKR